MRPRIQVFKPAKPPGRRFEVVQSGCSWCSKGEDPAQGTSICEACILKFRRRLASYRWRMARASFLSHPDHHYCFCGCNRLANIIDHIKPWRFFPSLFWESSNWQPAYHDCNVRKGIEDNRMYGKDRRHHEQ